MNCLRLLLLVCAMVWFEATVAQQELRGKVVRDDSVPVAGATVLLRAKQNIGSYYAITDTSGEFRMTVPLAEADSFWLEASHLSFEKTFRKIVPGQGFYLLVLSPSTGLRLPEVVVKAAPMQRTGDTVRYRVAAFAGATDRVIGDVIDRLPGVSRNALGQITYMGRPINRYYIEGLDLLGSHYGLANETIRPELVETVEVLERNQHIRALDSLLPPNEVALNLRLNNKARNRWGGQAEVAAGVPLPLYQGALNVMKFTDRFQMLAVAKTNNSGQNLSRQFSDLSVHSGFLQQHALRTEPLLQLPKAGFEQLPEQLYLLNETAAPAVNLLYRKKTGWQHRLNVHAYRHLQYNDFGSRQQIVLPGDTVRITEENNWHLRGLYFKAAYQNEVNTQNRYLLNEASLSASRTGEHLGMLGSFASLQNLQHGYLQAAHRLSLMHKIKVRPLLFRLEAEHRFLYIKTSLTVLPGMFAEVLNNGEPMQAIMQQVPQEYWSHIAQASVVHTQSKWQQQWFVRTKAVYGYFRSAIEKDLGQWHEKLPSPYTNHFRFNTTELQAGWKGSRTWRKTTLLVEVPVALAKVLRRDSSNSQRRTLFLMLPALNAEHKWGDFTFRAASRLALNSFAAQENFTGYIAANYRTLTAYPSDFLVEKNWSNSLSLQFTQPVSGWSAHGTATLLLTMRNLLPETQLIGIFADRYYLAQPNTQQLRMIQAGGGKYFFAWKSGLQWNLQWTGLLTPVVQNGAFQEFTSNSMTMTARLYSKKISGVHLDVAGKWMRQVAGSTLTGTVPPAYFWSSQAGVTSFMFKNHLQVGFTAEWGRGSRRHTRSFLFADAQIHYQWRKIGWRVVGSNLFNHSLFQISSAQFNTASLDYIFLRQRNLLLSATIIL